MTLWASIGIRETVRRKDTKRSIFSLTRSGNTAIFYSESKLLCDIVRAKHDYKPFPRHGPLLGASLA